MIIGQEKIPQCGSDATSWNEFITEVDVTIPHTAGTVTVLGSDCNTGDNIMVSHYDNSGVALGHLYVVNVGNGAFDIRSTSATDDANVSWHVIH